MKAPHAWIIVLVAFLTGGAVGWLVTNLTPPSIEDNPLVIRLKAERDSLVRVAAALDQRATRWKDSVAVLDIEIARVNSVNTDLATKAGQYEKEIGIFHGTPDDLHRELNRLIRRGIVTPRADSASGVLR